jgi:hypothetical protein
MDLKQAKNVTKQPPVSFVSLFRETAINRFIKNPMKDEEDAVTDGTCKGY